MVGVSEAYPVLLALAHFVPPPVPPYQPVIVTPCVTSS